MSNSESKVTVQDVINKMEELAPLNLKENNDPTGFQIGDPNAETKNILVTLDVRPEVVEEAIDKDIDLIVSHHPAIFRPIKQLNVNNPQNLMYADIVQNNISVYSSHTNMDKAKPGMNDWLAEKIGLINVEDLPVENENDVALGRVGDLKTPMAANDFAQLIKDSFGVKHLRATISDSEFLMQRIAIIGGDGGKFYPEVLKSQADAFITGDLYYHTAQDMEAYGLNVFDPGHHIESIFKEKIAEYLRNWAINDNLELNISESELNTDPFTFY